MLIGLLIFPYGDDDDDDIIYMSIRPSIGNYTEQQSQKQQLYCTVKFTLTFLIYAKRKKGKKYTFKSTYRREFLNQNKSK